uniref:Transmembrane protein 255B n=1 Tax=Malurus cyaneus samueli TaxID=2593467 RepID=A0A8C5TL42_9PASS
MALHGPVLQGDPAHTCLAFRSQNTKNGAHSLIHLGFLLLRLHIEGFLKSVLHSVCALGWDPGVSNLWLQLKSSPTIRSLSAWSRLQAGGECAGFHFGCLDPNPGDTGFCKKEEDFTLVHSCTAGRVCLHTDHRSGSYHTNRKCYCGRLLPSLFFSSQLVASIVFISFGVVAAFCCAIVDGVFAARHIEPRPLYNKRCQFYSSGIGFLYDAYQTEVTCHTLNSKCQLKVKSNTCYCCDLYNCENSDQSSSYYEFLGVSSCQDVVHLYRLLWSSTVLNIIGLFLGIITAAILGAFKDMVPLSQIAFSAAPPPQILYNPAQQILTYAGFCPSPATISTYPSYPLPLQPASNFPGTSSTDISLSEETQPPSQSSSSYGLPPNAPALYTPTYCLPGEKPPPYAP